MRGHFVRTYELWRATCVPDGMGGRDCSWGKVDDIPGRAYPSTMNQEFAAQRLQGVVVWTFAAGADADVQEGDQIRFDGRVLKVQAVSATSTGRRLEALCEETRP